MTTEKTFKKGDCVMCGGKYGKQKNYNLLCDYCYKNNPSKNFVNLKQLGKHPEIKQKLLYPCAVCGCNITKGKYCRADADYGWREKQRLKRLEKKALEKKKPLRSLAGYNIPK